MAGRRRIRGRGRNSARRLVDRLLTLVFFALLALAIAWFDQRSAQTFEGRARAVDGDSIVLDGKRMRLSGIDAPELGQTCERQGRPWECGRQSRSALRDLLRQPDISCLSHGLDQYDRWLVTCSSRQGNINAKMVEEGWAVAFGDYRAQEETARRQQKGIWQGDFVRPQVWRRQNRERLSQDETTGVDRADTESFSTGVMDRVRMWFGEWVRR